MGTGAEADAQTCSKGNQGSLIAHHTPDCPQLPPSACYPPVSGPSAKRHGGGGAGGPLTSPSPRVSIGHNHWLPHSSCSAWPHCREMLLEQPQLRLRCSHILCCYSQVADQPGLSIPESCRRCLGQGCLRHCRWPDVPPEVAHPTPLPKLPRAALPCHHWVLRKEGAGGLPQPCPETKASGLKALEHEESTKRSKKLRY